MVLTQESPGDRPLRRDGVTLVGALLVIPVLLGVFGDWAIFALFGDAGGTHLGVGTFGYRLSDFWDAGGKGLDTGLVAFGFVLLRRRRPAPAIGLGLASAALAYVYWFVAVIVVLLLNPDALS